MERKKAMVIIDILKEMATTVSGKMPQYVDQEMSKFSTG